MAKQPAKDKNTRITETFNKETTTRIKSHSPITDTSSEQHNITSLTAELALESPRISVGSHPARRVSIIAANGSRRRSVASTASINSAVEESSASEDCFALEEFSSRPWVQEALNNPWHPNSVLSFFTGINCADPKSYKELLQRAKASGKMNTVIKHGGENYHSLCQPFAPVIRAAGRKTLVSSPSCDWSSVDGMVAQIVLCSHLARICFRGTPEAYAYNDVSVSLSQELHVLAASLLKVKTAKSDYKRLRKSFASMSILAATYSSGSAKSGRGSSARSSSRRSRADVCGTRTSGSQRSNRSQTSRMTPRDSITMNSSCRSSSGHSLAESLSLESVSTVSLDEQIDELEHIFEGDEDEKPEFF